MSPARAARGSGRNRRAGSGSWPAIPSINSFQLHILQSVVDAVGWSVYVCYVMHPYRCLSVCLSHCRIENEHRCTPVILRSPAGRSGKGPSVCLICLSHLMGPVVLKMVPTYMSLCDGQLLFFLSLFSLSIRNKDFFGAEKGRDKKKMTYVADVAVLLAYICGQHLNFAYVLCYEAVYGTVVLCTPMTFILSMYGAGGSSAPSYS